MVDDVVQMTAEIPVEVQEVLQAFPTRTQTIYEKGKVVLPRIRPKGA
jgi:hypothetical protein